MSSATTSFTMYTSSYTGSCLQWVQLQWVSQCTLHVTLGPAYNEFSYNKLHNVHFKLHWVLLTMSSATTSFTMCTSSYTGSCLQWVRLQQVSQCTLQVTLGPVYNEFGYNKIHGVHFELHWVLLTMCSALMSLTMHTSSYTGSCLQWVRLQRATGCNENGVFPKCFTEFSDKYICRDSKRARTCHLLCKRPGCQHSASKTCVRDGIFKLTPGHASVIYQIPWICWIHWIQWKFRPV